mmetsp:Transcript_32396/g.108098  ORF Transcript_32396/g.108098 Transcript_32396/m.108098 type:complete len:383 (-) Transcript_32396:7-1155(-)
MRSSLQGIQILSHGRVRERRSIVPESFTEPRVTPPEGSRDPLQLQASAVVVLGVAGELGAAEPGRARVAVAAVEAGLVQACDLGEVVLVELEREHLVLVGLDALRRDRLRDDGHGAPQTPREQDDVRRGAVLGGDLADHRVVRQRRALVELPHRVRSAAHAAVRRDCDPVRLAVLEELAALVVRVRLELVACDGLARDRLHTLELRNLEVAHADVPHEPLVHQLLHRPPRVLNWDVVHLVGRDRLVAAGHKGHRKVHQVQVEVLDAQMRHRVKAALPDELRAVVALPQLGGDPQVRARRNRALRDHLLDRLAHLSLVLVHPRLVDVPIPELYRLFRALVHLARLREPGAVANRRHCSAARQSQCGHCGHRRRRHVCADFFGT